MKREELVEFVLNVLDLNGEDVDENTDLESLDFESFSNYVLVSAVSETFNKTISVGDLSLCRKIGDIADLIERLIT